MHPWHQRTQPEPKLGLIGGVGPQTTAPYYLGITEGVRSRVFAATGRSFFPRISIENLSAYDVIGMSGRGEWNRLTDCLLQRNRVTRSRGRHALRHGLRDRAHGLGAACLPLPLPLLHILEPVAAQAQAMRARRVILLGTAATMRCEGFARFFAERGVELVTPAQEDRGELARIIEEKLEAGAVPDASARFVDGVVLSLAERSGADAVLLGCTELLLLFRKIEAPLPLIDPVALHIEALVEGIDRDVLG